MATRSRRATTAPAATGQRAVRVPRWSAITTDRACATMTRRSPGTPRTPRAGLMAAAVRTISRAPAAMDSSIASPPNKIGPALGSAAVDVDGQPHALRAAPGTDDRGPSDLRWPLQHDARKAIAEENLER